MKAIHNYDLQLQSADDVVVYLKDTEKWKQFTTNAPYWLSNKTLLCISKILKNESNSQLKTLELKLKKGCCVSQRYWKMKAIHNHGKWFKNLARVVVYLKDTEKWKQFTTCSLYYDRSKWLLCISKILKNESNSQLRDKSHWILGSCCVSQRYWKMKAIHNDCNFRTY